MNNNTAIIMNPYEHGIFTPPRYLKAANEACKTYERDIIGLANGTATEGQITDANGTRRPVARLPLGILNNGLRSTEETYYSRATCLACAALIVAVAGIIIAALSFALASFICTGVGLLLLGAGFYNMYQSRKLCRELGLQTVLEAQEYYTQGPGPKAQEKLDYLRQYNIAFAARCDADAKQYNLDPDAGDAARAHNVNLNETRAKQNQALQETFMKMKHVQPDLAARTVARIFQGNMSDINVSSFQRDVERAYNDLRFGAGNVNQNPNH